jgi:hypothetical protein|tara:strand:- start:172 stop:504 length:333 start_codon:yes stop_codon:yes gene_type:complete
VALGENAMSIAIDVDKVSAVLIGNQWFCVDKLADGRSSFDIDAYEFVWPHPDRPNGDPARYLGDLDQAGSTCTGYTFKHIDNTIPSTIKGIKEVQMSGPITEIQAVWEST